MAQETNKGARPKSKPAGREDRLKAALKANMGRRKAQARARTGAEQKTQARTGAEEKTQARAGADEKISARDAADAQNTEEHAGKPAEVDEKGRADG